jgi:AmmeMemoRadiSam system protein A
MEDPKLNPAVFAKTVVTAALKHEHLPDPPDEEYYRQQAACFVSVKKEGQLRGCIGTLEPGEDDLGHEIIHNAQSAAFGDPRFPSVIDDELDALTFSVDVLSDAEPIESQEQLDCRQYGVIVSCSFRRGVLLPDLEGVDTPEDQVSIACQKAGIDAEEDYDLHRFTVTRYDESGRVENSSC